MANSRKIVFKTYNQNQGNLLPLDLNEMIEANHPVRVINAVVDQLEIDSLLNRFKGGGTSSYHPRMLLKVLVYAYMCNEYSSRRIEELVKRDVHFIWLASQAKPDHNTINRFRSDRLKGVFKQVFGQVVRLMAQSGVINLKEAYIDGTKIEANANRYTFVWSKSVQKNLDKIGQQLEAIWNYAEGIAAEELKDKRPTDFSPVSPEAVQQTIHTINEALQNKEVDPKIKSKLNYGKKNWPSNVTKYKAQQEILGDRNSFSKTDEGATFMRMKNDPMGKQLKPAYNVQISTQDQYVLNYTLHQTPGDTTTLPEHLTEFKQTTGRYPDEVCTDAGYGSEENYILLEAEQIEAFVKYNHFDKEEKNKQNCFDAEYLFYNPSEEVMICPMGQKMDKIGEFTQINANGFLQTLHRYQAKNCNACPMRGVCHNQRGNRIITINHKALAYKRKARERLRSEKGIYHRKKRSVDVETVFGNWKQNKGFVRLSLRGKEKVTLEIGLIALAHNLSKWARSEN